MVMILTHINLFLAGLMMSLALAGLSGFIATIFGTILCLARVSPFPILQWLASAYVNIFRNTPLTILFFFVAFVLPSLGISMSYFKFGVIALSIYFAAFFSEAIRAGLNAVPAGQIEAARSIGLTTGDVLRDVVLPQAFRAVIPPLINVLVALVKSTSIASAFGVSELMTVTQQFSNDHSQFVIETLITAVCLYLCITIPAGLIAGRIEKRIAVVR